ncbi:MAG: hypothetical protein DA408_18330 [Bacteroidetes bacterium]|nr:MAG: hypothetical protein C7N36_11740 [Bacteroidota bacterium]PTM09439.1 MAG: hypothetical protein DA408_18330 [Bacteroidota bacterium]
MTENYQSQFREHLSRGEHLIWTGKPKSGIVFKAADVFVIPFSIFWCGFSIFWVIMAAQSDVIFALFGVPFVFLGLNFVFGRFILDAWQRKNTVYGFDRRANTH